MGPNEFNWHSATPEERRAHWVKTLRSNKYKQTTSTLQDAQGFCCLGVLCDLADDHRWAFEAPVFNYLAGGTKHNTMPPDYVLEDVGVTESQAGDLADLNDNGLSFELIADCIEHQDWHGDTLADPGEPDDHSVEDEAA